MIKYMDPQVCNSCLRASVQAPRELLELLLQPLQAPRELLLQPFILCSASFPNQRDAFLRLVVIFQRVSRINSPNSVASL